MRTNGDGGRRYRDRARLSKAIAALLKRGLAEEREIGDKFAIHRVDGDVAFGLYITNADNAAIGITEGDGGGDPGETPAPSPALPDKPRVTKATAVLALLGHEEGATGRADRCNRLTAAHDASGTHRPAQERPCAGEVKTG